MAKIRLMTQQQYCTMEDAFEDFIRFSKAKNLSESTLNNYRKQFKKFYQWYDGTIEGIKEETIYEYIEYLTSTGIKDVSINTSLRHIRAIFNYFADKNLMQPISIRLMRVSEEVKEVYTDAELQRLLKKPNISKTTFPEYRTWTIINFIMATGCRIGTVISAKIGDIDFDNGFISYSHTKNRKAQYVPLDSYLADILLEYLRYRGGTSSDYLFPSETGTKLLGTSVGHDIAKYNRSRGVEKTSAHLFRHTFTRHWLMQNGDVLRLQKILGHSSLDMVQHYANLYKADLKQGYEQFNLLSKFKTQRIKIK